MAGRPRTKPAEVRRDELMAAAAGLFVEKGAAATTIDEIVAGAGVAKGTFYLHFASKEDLLAALRQRFVEIIVGRIEAALAARPADDWAGRLQAWAEAAIDAYLDNHTLHDVVFHDFRPDHRAPKGDNPVVHGLAGLLADGPWAVGAPHRTAVFLFHGLHGAVDEAIATGAVTGADRAGLKADMARMFARCVTVL